ncbi:MAG: lipid-binding SYLF domain-containing protein [Proteobacteria bacterium]|nr:lipid-binding SYLF domain-containing protein [Pseudomonadota bacterium]
MATTIAMAQAQAASDEQELVDRAKVTVDALTADPNFKDFHDMLDRAKAVIVMPQLIRAGFVVGGEGGAGVLLGRTQDAQRKWSYPAFLSLGSASVGFQIGAEVSEVILVVMTDRGLDKLLGDKVTLGGDLSLAVGNLGGRMEASTTTNVGADVYAFGRSKGLFGGVALKGGILIPNEDSDKAYYGASATTRDIVIEQKFSNPDADRLREALSGT